MEKFLQRKDRFEFFESFENPLLNMTIRFECPNFMDFCKKKNIPAFQFFLFCISETIKKIDNFQYRTLGSEVIKVDKFLLSYTVLNQEGLFNYTDFEAPSSFQDFLKTSLDAKAISETTTELINTGHDASLKELKNFTFVTSLPWLDFTSIEHPIYKFKSADIPAIAWGKFSILNKEVLQMPLSIQAHHGFVDGVHIYEFTKQLTLEVKDLMKKL